MRSPMTPLERVGLLLMDEAPDRLIVAPILTGRAAAFAGLDPGTCAVDAAALAAAQLATQEALGTDAFFVFLDVGIVAEAAGSRYRRGEEGLPVLEAPAVAEPADLFRLAAPHTGAGRFPVCLDATSRLFAARGDRVPTFVLVPAPFTTAAGLRGIEEFLTDTIVEPAFAKDLLEFATRATVPLLDAIVLAGGLPAFVDPLASASVLSPAAYRDFAGPATRALVERLHLLDLDILLHVCGEVDPILPDLAATGADLLSFDRTEIAAARVAAGDAMRLVGNVSPSLLLEGPPDRIVAEVRRAAAAGRDAPRGFVLSTGCEVPAATPREHLTAFMDAARAAGAPA